jgi:uncharacterized protein (DUF1778 family)
MTASRSRNANNPSAKGQTFVATQMRFDRVGLSKIDRAAELSGATRSEFVRRSAVVEAEKVLLDQVYFGVDRKTFDFFSNVLSKPPSGEGYKNLMCVKSPWDKTADGK